MGLGFRLHRPITVNSTGCPIDTMTLLISAMVAFSISNLKDAITPYYGVKGVTFSLVDKDGKPLSASQIKALEREWIMKRIDSRTM